MGIFQGIGNKIVLIISEWEMNVINRSKTDMHMHSIVWKNLGFLGPDQSLAAHENTDME